jgi:DNA-binding NtrC family response regulator
MKPRTFSDAPPAGPNVAPGLHVLFVDEEAYVLREFVRAVRQSCEAVAVSDAGTALRVLEAVGPFDAIVANFVVPNDWALPLLAAVRTAFPGVLRVLLSGDPRDHGVVRATRQQDVDLVFATPCSPTELLYSMQLACALERVLREAA